MCEWFVSSSASFNHSSSYRRKEGARPSLRGGLCDLSGRRCPFFAHRSVRVLHCYARRDRAAQLRSCGAGSGVALIGDSLGDRHLCSAWPRPERFYHFWGGVDHVWSGDSLGSVRRGRVLILGRKTSVSVHTQTARARPMSRSSEFRTWASTTTATSSGATWRASSGCHAGGFGEPLITEGTTLPEHIPNMFLSLRLLERHPAAFPGTRLWPASVNSGLFGVRAAIMAPALAKLRPNSTHILPSSVDVCHFGPYLAQLDRRRSDSGPLLLLLDVFRAELGGLG